MVFVAGNNEARLIPTFTRMILRPILILMQTLTTLTLPLMSQTPDIKVLCDPATGLCTLPKSSEVAAETNWKDSQEIIYIGDPMCSWCWGISPEINALQRYGLQKGIPLTLTMGGLRPGGGEAWNDDFKNFLKHHWQEVNERSGQPFGYQLFDLESFDYDTEPACRAVVTVGQIEPHKTLSFYEYVQHHFYVKSEDPKQVAFYKPICEALDLDFEQFSKLFLSEDMKVLTAQDFSNSRSWGIRGFPSVIYRDGDELHLIAQGYVQYDDLKDRIEKIQSE